MLRVRDLPGFAAAAAAVLAKEPDRAEALALVGACDAERFRAWACSPELPDEDPIRYLAHATMEASELLEGLAWLRALLPAGDRGIPADTPPERLEDLARVQVEITNWLSELVVDARAERDALRKTLAHAAASLNGGAR